MVGLKVWLFHHLFHDFWLSAARIVAASSYQSFSVIRKTDDRQKNNINVQKLLYICTSWRKTQSTEISNENDRDCIKFN